MACEYHVISDAYANFPYPYEEEYIRDEKLSFLEDLKNQFKNIKNIDIKSTREFVYTMKTLMGTELIFYIKPANRYEHHDKSDTSLFFGWKHEGYMQERSWHYICKDIRLYYGSGH